MDLVVDVLVVAGWAGSLLGIVWYLPRRPWRTDMGRHLLTYMSAVAALYSYVLAGLVWGDYPGRLAVTLSVAVVLCVAVWQRAWKVRGARSGKRTGVHRAADQRRQ